MGRPPPHVSAGTKQCLPLAAWARDQVLLLDWSTEGKRRMTKSKTH